MHKLHERRPALAGVVGRTRLATQRIKDASVGPGWEASGERGGSGSTSLFCFLVAAHSNVSVASDWCAWLCDYFPCVPALPFGKWWKWVAIRG